MFLFHTFQYVNTLLQGCRLAFELTVFLLSPRRFAALELLLLHYLFQLGLPGLQFFLCFTQASFPFVLAALGLRCFFRFFCLLPFQFLCALPVFIETAPQVFYISFQDEEVLGLFRVFCLHLRQGSLHAANLLFRFG